MNSFNKFEGKTIIKFFSVSKPINFIFFLFSAQNYRKLFHQELPFIFQKIKKIEQRVPANIVYEFIKWLKKLI